jgi:hypothetical protein
VFGFDLPGAEQSDKQKSGPFSGTALRMTERLGTDQRVSASSVMRQVNEYE